MNEQARKHERERDVRDAAPRHRTKPCRFPTCPGHYERRRIVHHEPFRGGTVFIDGVPAKVCRVCGDVLFPADTAYALDEWRDRLEAGEAGPPDRADLYHFGSPERPAQAA